MSISIGHSDIIRALKDMQRQLEVGMLETPPATFERYREILAERKGILRCIQLISSMTRPEYVEDDERL